MGGGCEMVIAQHIHVLYIIDNGKCVVRDAAILLYLARWRSS